MRSEPRQPSAADIIPVSGIIRRAQWYAGDPRFPTPFETPRLTGNIHGHAGVPDGTRIWTNAVIEDLGRDMFRTRSGSIYKAEWIDAAAADEFRPTALQGRAGSPSAPYDRPDRR